MSKNKYHERLKKVIQGIQVTAEHLSIHPSEVSKGQFFKFVEDVNDWDLRMVGGLGAVKRAHFPIVSKDLVTIREQKETAKYINDLEKQLANAELFEQEIKDKLNSIVTPVKVTPYKPTKRVRQLKRHVGVMLNDTHYGLKVDPLEVGGTNSFSWVESCRRTAYLVKQVCDYKIDKRDEVETLHVILNGDLVQGVIHDLTARTAELLTHQINGTMHILGYAIASLAANYPKVVVHGVAGNHDDMIHRREGGRVLSHKYDSYANIIYFALSSMFKDQKNVSFSFPKSLYGTIDLPCGRIAYTHGDTMFSSQLGNPGKTLNTMSLGDAISRFNSGEIDKSNPKIKGFLFGHVHTHTEFTTYDGVRVLIAPSLSGVDAYAASLAINHNQVGQLIFESTSEHLIGDKRIVELVEADKDESLDQIIPVFSNELTWQK